MDGPITDGPITDGPIINEPITDKGNAATWSEISTN